MVPPLPVIAPPVIQLAPTLRAVPIANGWLPLMPAALNVYVVPAVSVAGSAGEIL